MHRIGRALLLAGLLAWMGGFGLNQANAAPLVPELVSVTDAGGGLFLWTYSASIQANERVQTGPNTTTPVFPSSRPDFFVIIDFFGFAGGGATSQPGWAFSSANTGPFPDLLNATNLQDDPSIPNVTWTRTGATITGQNPDLGTFSVLSSVGLSTGGVFGAETTEDGGTLDNTNLITAGSVPVPVPEPATVLLVLAGPLFLFGAVKGGLRLRPAPAA